MRRIFTIGTLLLYGLLHPVASLPQSTKAELDKANRDVRNIVLVHGAWANSSSWSKVIPLLEAKGFNVVAAALPLTSLQDDDAAAQRAIAQITAAHPGPVLLVGHSYGGVVIGDTPGTNPSVVGLVYVAAFAPDTGQSALGLLMGLKTLPSINNYLVFNADQSFATISPQGVKRAFAQLLEPREQSLLTVTQGPTALAALTATPTVIPAWKSKPSWFVVSEYDDVITAGLEEKEARILGSTTIRLPTCHVAMLQEPYLVADFIAQAAGSLNRR
jgi:pimeloyl-ACP methyl ester carboxylesterase